MSKARRPLDPVQIEESARLRAVFEQRKAEAKAAGQSLTQADIGEACGWASGQSVVNQLMTARLPLNLESLLRLAAVLRFRPDEVSPRLAEMITQAMGGEPVSTASRASAESNAELIGMMSPWDNSTPLHDDEVAIPLYKEVELAAGGGATEVVEVPGRLLRFAKSTLREAGVLEQNAACASVSGNSMERLIMDGATIGIDKGSTNIIDGEIYAFDHDGMLRVKYLYRLPGGGIRIRSENDEEYPDELLTAEESKSIRILGWVFWWSIVRRKRGLSIAR